MKEIKLVYGVGNLGSDIVENIRESLDNEGVKCFSGSSEPTQEKMPIILQHLRHAPNIRPRCAQYHPGRQRLSHRERSVLAVGPYQTELERILEGRAPGQKRQ
jgi:hypothetical protein